MRSILDFKIYENHIHVDKTSYDNNNTKATATVLIITKNNNTEKF